MMSAGFKMGPKEELGPRHGEGLTFLSTVARESFYWGTLRVLKEGRKGGKKEEIGI